MSTDELAAEIMGYYRERLDRGEAVDPEDIVREYPDLADTLRRRFTALQLLEDSFGPARETESAR